VAGRVSKELSLARDAWIFRGLWGLQGAPEAGGEFTDEEYRVLRDTLQDLQRVLILEELASTHDDWSQVPRAALAAHGLRDHELQTGEPVGDEWLYSPLSRWHNSNG
jgi:hypothetical protein